MQKNLKILLFLIHFHSNFESLRIRTKEKQIFLFFIWHFITFKLHWTDLPERRTETAQQLCDESRVILWETLQNIIKLCFYQNKRLFLHIFTWVCVQVHRRTARSRCPVTAPPGSLWFGAGLVSALRRGPAVPGPPAGGAGRPDPDGRWSGRSAGSSCESWRATRTSPGRFCGTCRETSSLIPDPNSRFTGDRNV